MLLLERHVHASVEHGTPTLRPRAAGGILTCGCHVPRLRGHVVDAGFATCPSSNDRSMQRGEWHLRGVYHIPVLHLLLRAIELCVWTHRFHPIRLSARPASGTTSPATHITSPSLVSNAVPSSTATAPAAG